MFRVRSYLAVAAMAVLGAGCAGYSQASSAGDVLDPVEAARTVVLHVENLNTQSMELRTIVNGKSEFAGSVGGSDTTSILMDPSLFPAGFLYIEAIPGNGLGRALVGPLSASKGQWIRFTIQPALDLSSAVVRR
jgi:hypothetical protein